MADYYEIAKMIPAEYRRSILEKNHIFKAVVQFHDWDMMQLWFYWKNFIEPDSQVYDYTITGGKVVVASHNQCGICLRKLLDKWKLLEPYMVALEVEEACLNSLK